MGMTTAIIIFVIGLACLWLASNLDELIERHKAKQRQSRHYKYGPQKGGWWK